MARTTRPPSNREVADALREMALFLEMEGVAFKPRAYEKAALAVDALDRPLHEIEAESGAEAIENPQLALADTLGVAVARRGWARRADVIDTLPVAECLARLEAPPARRRRAR